MFVVPFIGTNYTSSRDLNELSVSTKNFEEPYNCKLNLFVKEFLKDYSLEDGSVDWKKLIKMNSGKKS